MDRVQLAEALIASGRPLERTRLRDFRKTEAEGGCGVVGTASSVPLPGRALLRGLEQMKNRGNGKGGGIAAAGLDPAFFGARAELLRDDYLLTLAYLDPSARRAVESSFVEPTFEVDHVFELPTCADGLSIRPPDVCCYFARVRPDVRAEFLREHGIPEEHAEAACDEIVYQSSYVLNRAFYSPTEEQRAFVLSHGKDLLVLKLVGYGDDVVRHYRLEDLEARVWIGHHRYPTKGRVWHPGGAHPFVGVHEALVHNGDFANYASICTYLAQRNRFPLFLTDTEAAVLVFDLLHRVYGYPLEATIEAMAPTTERDFALLPAEKQRLYRLLQAVHVHGSPDGPWFFLVAQSARRDGVCRLVGITDTSMLRPQVFALQRGREAIGLAASEKQAIDAVLESLSEEDERFWSRADLYWNARGGSHTDGGAFVFTVPVDAEAGAGFLCTDKFGRRIEPDASKRPIGKVRPARVRADLEPEALLAEIPSWSYGELSAFLDRLVHGEDREHALAVLTLLMDRCYPTGEMKRSCILSLLDASLASLIEGIRRAPSTKYVWAGRDEPLRPVDDPEAIVVVDARGLSSEGEGSLSRVLVSMHERGLRRFVVTGARGQRFIGCGLGPTTHGTRIDVYGSSGDYLASGLDGAELVVHGTAQDQVAQIMKDGTLTLYGDVGQTFMYAAKGGSVFVLGSAAGRPLINAVGRPRVVINGTCLDYLAESFMAGDPLVGGGFAILNGVAFDEDGALRELETPYPGGNLFSLASGGALFVRDPLEKLTVDQLNGGAFVALGAEDWALVEPCLEENERLFGIPLEFLLTVDGGRQPPERVYRKIQPVEHAALTPEEAWVKRKA
jgi:glutamate synthase domain-containing protein 1/glutamate synthase domain-containing protein 3